jgi:hypothetical protein
MAKKETKPKKFSPNFGTAMLGNDYDYASAKQGGLKRAENGHLGTRNPKSGQILKSRSHETWDLGVQGETEAGYQMYQGKEGKYHSQKPKKGKPNNSLFKGKNEPFKGR